MALPNYFIASGDLKFAKLDPTTGLPLAWWDIGEVPVVEWDATVEYASAFSTGKAGPNLQNLHVPIKRTSALTVQAEEKVAQNLEYFFHGAKTAPAGANYTGADAFPSGIVAGETYLLPAGHVGVSVVVIKDSAGSPATLVNGTDYTVNADAGLITFVNIPGVQPYKAFSYTYSLSKLVKILSATPAEVAVLFDGINLAVPGERIRALFDRIAFAPAAKISLKAGSATGTANTPEMYDLKGVPLLGLGKVATDGYGTYREY